MEQLEDKEVKYKWLWGVEAAEILNPRIKEKGWAEIVVTDPPTNCAFVAMKAEEVLGFIVLSLFPMVGPMESGDPQIGQVLIRGMMEQVDKLPGYVVVAENPKVGRFCESIQMKELPFPIYYK